MYGDDIRNYNTCINVENIFYTLCNVNDIGMSFQNPNEVHWIRRMYHLVHNSIKNYDKIQSMFLVYNFYIIAVTTKQKLNYTKELVLFFIC